MSPKTRTPVKLLGREDASPLPLATCEFEIPSPGGRISQPRHWPRTGCDPLANKACVEKKRWNCGSGVSMCDTSRFFQLHFASSVCVNDSEIVELLGTCNLFSTIFCGSVDVHCLIYWY
uniref:Uncharacterized protein n=1 Tax=Oryza nivara TaxID=4536 RepID=A0A0E0FJJ0_ORYNI